MDQPTFSDYTILIAEDDDSNFEYIQQTFRSTGLTILHAANGLDAVTICKTHPEIKLVLMDGMMPVMTGYEASREIRKTRPGLPIVILTAYVSQDSIREAVMGGCNDYIAKPIGPEELLSLLKKWLAV
jgi:CheY-like chemotaxis protein